MNTRYAGRVLFLILYILGLYFLFQYLGHPIFEQTATQTTDIFLFSSLSLLAINVLLLSSFFETPKDVIASSINVLILLGGLLLYDKISVPLLSVLFIYTGICLLISILSVAFYNPDASPSSLGQRISNFFKKTSTMIGSSTIIFGALIVSILINTYSEQNIAFYSFTIAGLIILANVPIQQFITYILQSFWSLFSKITLTLPDPIGHIEVVQSEDTFVVNLIDINKRPHVDKFNFIHFVYGADNTYIRGFVIDKYYLDSKQKIKIVKTHEESAFENNKPKYPNLKKNTVYKAENQSAEENDKLAKFVGTVIEKSDISQLKFEYSSEKMITDGELLTIKGKDKTGNSVNVLYQVVQANTALKILENRNETGIIEATAVQLGVWREAERNFEDYGWVFPISTAVSLATDIRGTDAKDGEIQIGKIGDTEFNVIVNMEHLITHHTAVLGTTGSGKSVFSRNLIRKMAETGNKVFCIDLTGEAKEFLSKKLLIDTVSNISSQGITPPQPIAKQIKWIVDNRSKDYGKNTNGFDKVESAIEEHMKTNLKSFIEDSSENIGIFELPGLSNTDETLEYTKFFFRALFDLAKEGIFRKQRACLFLEEAHTLIPEWNSAGVSDDKTARRLTNTIAQIALQGRKYNVGLMVVAQRTANVSKTILTQCNTVISFKQFDNTGKDFLVNHFGDKFIPSLSRLKSRHAIIAGKALKSNVPIIFKVPEILEAELPTQNIPEVPPAVSEAVCEHVQANVDFNPLDDNIPF